MLIALAKLSVSAREGLLTDLRCETSRVVKARERTIGRAAIRPDPSGKSG
jgi:hypothetical protein